MALTSMSGKAAAETLGSPALSFRALMPPSATTADVPLSFIDDGDSVLRHWEGRGGDGGWDSQGGGHQQRCNEQFDHERSPLIALSYKLRSERNVRSRVCDSQIKMVPIGTRTRAIHVRLSGIVPTRVLVVTAALKRRPSFGWAKCKVASATSAYCGLSR